MVYAVDVGEYRQSPKNGRLLTGDYLYGHNMDVVLNEFFELGVIGNYDENNKNYYWFHRGSTSLKSQFKIVVHPGLWNELAIRGRDS